MDDDDARPDDITQLAGWCAELASLTATIAGRQGSPDEQRQLEELSARIRP